MNTQSDGYIYIMINACLPKDMLKIGYTKRDPEHRAAELSQATGLPSEYIVAYERFVVDCERAEKLVHEKLKTYRTTAYRNDRSREFFKIKLKDAIKILDSISDKVGDRKPNIEKEELVDLEQYLKQTHQTGRPQPSSHQQENADDNFLEFDQITALHSNNYKEEIEILKKVGFTQYPKKFLDSKVREQAEKIFNNGMSESIPGLALQKIYRAAYMGNVQAIKWIINDGKYIKYWGTYDTNFII